jgi:lipoprotein-anchoring transpeptidase ErfK/SrfK
VGGSNLSSNLEQSVVYYPEKNPIKWYKNWKAITAIIIIIIAVILGAIGYYQATHFNANVKMNGVEVSGLSANGALQKLQTAVLKNEVFIGNEVIVDGKDTKMKFTEKDLPEIKKLLKNQWTFFPSFKTISYSLKPSGQDKYRHNGLKAELEQKLISMNQNLTDPIHAHASLVQGEIVVSEGIDGTKYDVAALLKEYEAHDYISEIRLDPVHISAVSEDSEMVQNEKQKLQDFLQQTVEYKVQDKVYALKAGDFIKNATLSEELTVTVDEAYIENIRNKIAEINESQSTLGKDFTFTTHSGKVISVKGQGYGWALDVEKETEQVFMAFENGETSVTASNIYGNGWSNEGYGYDTTANNGIGNTYAEVSIAEQRIWIYKDGELVLETNVVTGKTTTGEDTSPGVWYILFKRTNYTLTGNAVGKGPYAVEVDYWAPFTNSGQGFHDASWRTNWQNNAYIADGSSGCVNVTPSMMKAVYDHLAVYQPVIVY